ncbi:MAG: outer membrane beta-barrel protein, partial [Thiohalomonadales bacterium]|nr:outer membrane beta-barrel protein [Thiohalomonadales bacterium]
MFKWLALTLLLLSLPLVTTAEESKLYWGVMAGVTQLSLNNSVVNPLNEDLNLKSLSGRLGIDFGKYLSVEGRVMASDSDSYWYGYSFEVTYLGNISAKLNLPFGKERRVNVYGLVGYSSWKWTLKQGGSTWDDTDSGVSYGIGVDLFADRVNALNIEVIRYLD